MEARLDHPATAVKTPSRVIRSLAAILLAGSAGMLFLACAADPRAGYSFDSPYSDDVRTVHVPIFRNETFHRGVEFLLTDAIAKEIARSTPWRVTTAESANTVLTGTVTGSALRQLSATRDTNLAQEVAVVLTVEFEWIDNRTGKTLVARRNFSAAEAFVPARNYGEPLAVGENATIERLAEDIVAELRSTW